MPTGIWGVITRASGVTDVRLSVGDQGGSASAACRRARPFLGHLVTAHVNKKAFKPAAKDIKAKYYDMFRGKGEDMDLDDSD